MKLRVVGISLLVLFSICNVYGQKPKETRLESITAKAEVMIKDGIKQRCLDALMEDAGDLIVEADRDLREELSRIYDGLTPGEKEKLRYLNENVKPKARRALRKFNRAIVRTGTGIVKGSWGVVKRVASPLLSRRAKRARELEEFRLLNFEVDEEELHITERFIDGTLFETDDSDTRWFARNFFEEPKRS